MYIHSTKLAIFFRETAFIMGEISSKATHNISFWLQAQLWFPFPLTLPKLTYRFIIYTQPPQADYSVRGRCYNRENWSLGRVSHKAVFCSYEEALLQN